MFNEAFWFFYLIGVVSTLFVLVSVITGALSFVGSLSLFFGYLEEDAPSKKIGFRLAIAAVCTACILVFIPTQQALYAGGAQYAIEVVELDDTLLAFKDILDAKIADLSPTNGD